MTPTRRPAWKRAGKPQTQRGGRDLGVAAQTATTPDLHSNDEEHAKRRKRRRTAPMKTRRRPLCPRTLPRKARRRRPAPRLPHRRMNRRRRGLDPANGGVQRRWVQHPLSAAILYKKQGSCQIKGAWKVSANAIPPACHGPKTTQPTEGGCAPPLGELTRLIGERAIHHTHRRGSWQDSNRRHLRHRSVGQRRGGGSDKAIESIESTRP